MKVTVWIVPAIVLIMLFGSVAVGQATGFWKTSGADLRTLENASPEDIRGSSTLEAASEGFGIPMAELLALLGLPADTPAETKFKDVEEYIEVSVARDLIAERLGLAPVSAEDAVESQEEATPVSVPTEQAPATVTPSTVATAAQTPAADATVTHEPAAEASEEISGRSSLRQVSESSGIPLEELYAALDLPADLSPDSLLKDLRDSIEGFEIEAVRIAVDEYLAGQ